jgi:hypothetical protein
LDGVSKNEHGVAVSLGGQTVRDDAHDAIHETFETQTMTFTPPLMGNVAAVVLVYRVAAFGLSIGMKLRRTDKKYRQWATVCLRGDLGCVQAGAPRVRPGPRGVRVQAAAR